MEEVIDLNASNISGIQRHCLVKDPKRGKARFILRNGALGWGIPMFVLMAGGPGFFGVPYRAEGSVLYWLWQGALWVGAGALFGLVIWSIAEKQFNSQSDDKKH